MKMKRENCSISRDQVKITVDKIQYVANTILPIHKMEKDSESDMFQKVTC